MAGKPDIVVTTLAPTLQNFGAVSLFLSKMKPFSLFDLGTFAGGIQAQLASGYNLAALRGTEMVGYAGWLMTTRQVAENWVAGQGPLKRRRGPDAEAAVLTTVGVTDARCTLMLIRRARELNPGRRAYFKREALGQRARKTSVLIFSEPSD
jgi:hypothetical protein